MTNMEHYMWLWQQTTRSDRRDKIFETVVTKADVDIETLKWFWRQTTHSDRRDKILETVVTKADVDIETLKWFWRQTTRSDRRDKIFQAMLMAEQNRPVAPGKEGDMGTSIKYDVFISHASEDKESFVRDLAEKLSSKGLKVWYDEFTLSLGDSLRRSIDDGLAKSRYGVVVLSQNFFEKEWPQKELDALVAKEDGLDTVILPIWHGVTKKQVQSFSPILADRLAVSTDKGIGHVVNEILKVVKRKFV